MHHVEPTVDVSCKLCDLGKKAILLLKSKVRNLIDLDSVGYLRNCNSSNSLISRIGSRAPNEISCSINSMKRELSDENFLSVIVSGCEDLDLYRELLSRAKPSESEIPDDYFWHYSNCDCVVWLDALKCFHANPPQTKDGFILVNWEILKECNSFVDFMLTDLRDFKLIKNNSSLLEVWIILESVECKVLTGVFGITYLVFSPLQLNYFQLFIKTLCEDSELLYECYDTYLSKVSEISKNIPNNSVLESKLLISEESSKHQSSQSIVLDLASDDRVSNDDSNCIVPIPREEVVELRTCVHDTNGTFSISFEEWSNITMTDGDKISFRNDWTHLFSSKLEDTFVCVLCFKYKKIKKMCSRKCSNFFRAKAVCKFNNCLVFYFIIKNYPILSNANATIEVEYKVSGTLSAEHTDGRTVHSRHLSYSRRLHVATELTEKSISNYFYNQFPASDSPNNELDYGNFNKIKSSATLRKAKFDLSSLQRYSNENWSELSGLQEYYRNIILGNQIRGYIQITLS